LAYRYGMSFSQVSASPFWFPDTVLLCALLVTQPRRWPLYILAALPIRFFSEVARDIPTWFLATTFLIDSAKGLLTAVGLRRFVGVPLRLDTLPQFGRYLLIAVVTVPALGAFAGAAARYALGQGYWSAWDQWFMGDALAQLVLTPAICYWIFGSDFRALANTPRMIEAGLLTIGLLVATYFAANTGNLNLPLQQTLFYAPIPFLFWAALRFGMFGGVDVERDTDDYHRPALQIPFHRAAAVLHPAEVAARCLKAVFDLDRVAHALRVLAQLPVDVLAILGMQVAEPGIRCRIPLGTRVAGHCQP